MIAPPPMSKSDVAASVRPHEKGDAGAELGDAQDMESHLRDCKRSHLPDERL